jgi:hypothetical protein
MVLQIERESSSKYTDLGGKRLYGKRTYPSNKSLLGYLSRTLVQCNGTNQRNTTYRKLNPLDLAGLLVVQPSFVFVYWLLGSFILNFVCTS